MALRRENLEKAREYLEYAKSAHSRFEDRMSTAENTLKSDSNYQLFVEGTEMGKQLDEKLNSLITIARGASQNEVENIIKLLNAFVEVQEGLNNTGL